MTERNEQTSQALRALADGIAAVPGDADHPAYEVLEALVDGRLDDVEREVVESHAELCSQCTEDLGDLRSVRDAVTPVAPVRSSGWRVPAIAAAAAAVLLTIWVMRQPSTPAQPAQSTVATPATTAPPAVAPAPELLSAEELAVIDRVKAAGRLEIPSAIAALRGRAGTLLGGGTETSVNPLAPIGTGVLATRPSFSWNPVKGAEAYSVAVYDDRFKQLARSPRITETTWTATSDLPRERTLTWQVTAHMQGSDLIGPAPPQPEARFEVVDESTAASIAALRERLAARPLDLAILLAKTGLVADATNELRRAEANPETAAAARTLLSRLP